MHAPTKSNLHEASPSNSAVNDFYTNFDRMLRVLRNKPVITRMPGKPIHILQSDSVNESCCHNVPQSPSTRYLIHVASTGTLRLGCIGTARTLLSRYVLTQYPPFFFLIFIHRTFYRVSKTISLLDCLVPMTRMSKCSR